MESDIEGIFITHNSRIVDIQAEFTARYPFLKIDFFKPGKNIKGLKSIKIESGTSLDKLAGTGTSWRIDINCSRTISEISQDFLNTLGVIVQVSRKSGNVWNVISVTEGWTLKSQNTAGEFISSLMKLNPSSGKFHTI